MIDMTRCRLFDGGMGTMLQRSGLRAGECPERLNLTHPEAVAAIHRAYAQAGADILTANTFGASRWKLGEDPASYIAAGVALAKAAAAETGAAAALDVGPLGALLAPFGALSFDSAYDMFVEIMEAGAAAGADLVLIETMSDLLEAKAALLAAKERTDLPVFVTMTFGADGRTFLGVDPRCAAVTLASLGADAVGVNCSLGPEALLPVLKDMAEVTDLPLILQPNAGMPRMTEGGTIYDIGPEEFARWGARFLDAGAAVLGGCCGTTPDHIRALRPLLEGRRPARREAPDVCRLCGWQGTLALTPNAIVSVGERINPTGRPAMGAALRAKDWDYAAAVAIAEREEGADFLVVNAGLPDIDQSEALPALITAIQGVSPLPLVIDCSEPAALEKSLRVCRGRPLLNSVNGAPESLAAMLPMAVKYGTGLVVLALDGQGIRPDAAGRRDTALRAARAAEAAGVPKNAIFIDCLALAASASPGGVMAAPEAIRMVRAAGYKTILGVSNVSHGLPGRDPLNCAYLSACLAAGLNVAIVNTASQGIRDTLAAAKVLTGRDPACADYIARYQAGGGAASPPAAGSSLAELIFSGRKGEVPGAAEALLKSASPEEVIRRHIIPALDRVGDAYEAGTLFLPQLMAAAEAVKAAFAVLDRYLPAPAEGKGPVILATVKGDIHDIGKNIVKMVLENYGYRVVDLGKDVPPEAVVRAALETGAPLVGLSSLMTTTAQNIAETVKALRAAGASCKIMAGGAVVTQEFADRVGADFYVKDAAQSARVAALVCGDR